ncbi:MAG: hypothetical protein AB1646_17015, partial [Thermodesulfobacteriota bacterium]
TFTFLDITWLPLSPFSAVLCWYNHGNMVGCKGCRNQFREELPVRGLAERHWLPCLKGVWGGQISIKEAVASHGLVPVFLDSPFYLMIDSGWVSCAHTLFRAYRDEACNDKGSVDDFMLRGLAEIGELAMTRALPLLIIKGGDDLGEMTAGARFRLDETAAWLSLDSLFQRNPDVSFGALVLLLVSIELVEAELTSSYVDLLCEKEIQNDLGFTVSRIMKARFGDIPPDPFLELVERSGFSVSQKLFIEQWITREIDLVGV